MKTRNILSFFSLLPAACIAALSLTLASANAADRPNVIVMLIDDMGWMDSSTYGSKYYQTPNMTRLAEEGMLFTDGYASSPLCSPTRASIMSGQYPARLRLTAAITPKDVPDPKAHTTDNPKRFACKVEARDHMPLEIPTLAELLKADGYATAHIGKWHLSPSGHKWKGEGAKFNAENQGFDFVIGGDHRPGPPSYYSPYQNGIRNLKAGPDGEYLNERLAEEAIKWIDSTKEDGKPFFLNFWQYAVHAPIEPKKDLMPKYTMLRNPRWDQRCPENATMLESMDNSLGILLDYLDLPENEALKNNTLLIFTSDNGGMTHKYEGINQITSNRPLRGGKANTYEGGVREPWIIRWPSEIKPGTTCNTVVQALDIYPTVLEAVGLKAPVDHPVDGQSIIPLLEGKSMEHQAIFIDFPHNMGALCAQSSTVRLGDYKLLRFYHAGRDLKSHYYELFDLKRDPSESINLAAYMPNKVKDLDALIEAHLQACDALQPLRNPAFTGDPLASRANGKVKAKGKGKGKGKVINDRPKSLKLPEIWVYNVKGIIKNIKLLDENNRKRKTTAIVLGNPRWIHVVNEANGSVTLSWNGRIKRKRKPVTVLFGWSGGISVSEINDWTIEPMKIVF